MKLKRIAFILKLKSLLLFLLVSAYGYAQHGPCSSCHFTWHMDITTDHTQCGNTNSSNVPVLVKFTDASLKTLANGGAVTDVNGYDINFFSDSAFTTLLNWEVESYDGTAGSIIAWVKIPTISNTADITFFMGYGNSCITTFRGGAQGSVWQANYKAVWHLPNGTVLNTGDATTNVNNATNSAAFATNGIIYGAASLALNKFIHSPSLYNLFPGASGNRISLWVSISSFAGYPVIWSSGNGFDYLQPDPTGTKLFWVVGGTSIFRTYNYTFTVNTPYYIVCEKTASGDNGVLYINGLAQSPVTGVIGDYTNTGNTYYGSYNGTTSSPLTGWEDEIRIMNSSFGQDLVTIEYNNQKQGSTFIRFGPKYSDFSPVFPAAAISGTTTICRGTSTVLTGNGGGTYSWNTGSSGSSITVSPSHDTLYYVVVSNGICTDTAKQSIVVNTNPTAGISGPTTICRGASTTLTGTGGGTYLWNTGASGSSITVSPAATASYSVVVSNGTCSDTAQQTVSVNPTPTAGISGTTVICSGASTTLTGTGGGTYLWSTGAATSDITVSPAITSTYSVTVSNGPCSDSTYTTIAVNDCDTGNTTDCVPFLPNAFSPNDDGENDILYIYGNCIAELSLVIYDRWGEKVFETNNRLTGWDGTYKGQKLNSGVFVCYFRAKVISGKIITKEGNISLIR